MHIVDSDSRAVVVNSVGANVSYKQSVKLFTIKYSNWTLAIFGDTLFKHHLQYHATYFVIANKFNFSTFLYNHSNMLNE